MKYSLDSFFDVSGYADMISGWAFLEGCDNKNTKIYVDIWQVDGTKKRYETVKTERFDVDSTFHGVGQYVNTGFYVGIHVGDCVFQQLQVEVIVEYDGNYYSNGTILSHIAPRRLPKRKKNIAFLGGMNFEKGSNKVYELILADKEEKYNWYIMGGIDPSEPLFQLNKSNVKKVGIYSRGEINQLLLEYHIDLVCIFSVVSETFCYTLSEAYVNQIPVFAMDVGAVGERVRKLHCGWLLPSNITGIKLFQKMDSLLENEYEYRKIKESIKEGKHKSVTEMVQEYQNFYQKLYSQNIVYQKYDARAFYEAYEVNQEEKSSEISYKKKIEELQQKLNQIESSFWYKVTKNLYRIEFPGKQKLRKWIYKIFRKNKSY